MEREYEPADFPYPLNEDMAAAYAAKEAYDLSPSDSNKYWSLKEALYQIRLTLKSLSIAGYVTPMLCDEIEDYFWGFLL